MPVNPYGPRKATVTFDLKAPRKGACGVCGAQKTIYPARVHPEGRPWESVLICSDCLKRLQQEQTWPLPSA